MSGTVIGRLRKASHDRTPGPNSATPSEGGGRRRRRHPADAEEPHRSWHEPPGHRPVGTDHDRRGRSAVLLRRLRAFLRTRALGHYICTSVNDAVLHGLPHDYTLADGDLLSLDLAVSKGGVVADSAISFIVGDTKPPESAAMISATERALQAGIAAAGPGAGIGDISHAIGSTLHAAGYPINTEFGGHGVGSTMHQDPHVSNTGRPGRGYKLRPGLLLALEPWIMADTATLVTDADGWTLRSATGSRTAHSEHTIAITPDGP